MEWSELFKILTPLTARYVYKLPNGNMNVLSLEYYYMPYMMFINPITLNNDIRGNSQTIMVYWTGITYNLRVQLYRHYIVLDMHHTCEYSSTASNSVPICYRKCNTYSAW